MSLQIRRLSLTDDLGNFDCGDESLNEYIWYQALEQQSDGSSTVYLACQGNVLVAFVSLSMSRIDVDLLAIQHVPQNTPYAYFPALMIGRLATDMHYQRKGIGSYLCRFAVAKALDLKQQVGCQFVILNAKTNSIPFYLKNGFQLGTNQPSHRREPFMYFKLPAP